MTTNLMQRSATSGMSENTYYRVTKSFDVHVLVAQRPSNAYYGSARLYAPVYERVTLKRGAVVASLVGGTFVSTDKRTARNVRLNVREFAPFERSNGDHEVWPLDKLTKIERVELTFLQPEVRK